MQELFLELAHVDGGMLDQRGDFVQQRGDFRIVAQRGGQAAGVVQQLALDVGAAASNEAMTRPLSASVAA